MKLNLDDCGLHLRFAPLTLTRPVGNLRMGIFTNDERWKTFLPNAEIGFITEQYLSKKFKKIDAYLRVNAALIPNEEIVAAVINLEENTALYWGDQFLASKGTENTLVKYTGLEPLILNNRWDLYRMNDDVFREDFKLVSSGRTSIKISDSNLIIGDKTSIFIEEGATVEGAIINALTGPVYIGKNAEIMEGSMVRGPLALCEQATLKMGAKVYGATTIGPHCKVGGEVSNCIFQSYSNKGHDGFLGNSLIGEWCNLGADTNSSNLKNNYGNVSTYSFEDGSEINTDVMFMGVCMGDHSKCGINTMFNTATVIGVSVNIYGAGFPSKYVPSFSWGGSDNTVPFRFEKAIEYADNMMSRRGANLSTEEIGILKYILEHK